MVLAKSERITALQNEARILVHLAGRLDDTSTDFRPTPKQRSSLELLRCVGGAEWGEAAEEAATRDRAATVARPGSRVA